jgi:phosphatidylglycerol:prolipoprotein diacylglycerol transferase
MAMSVLAGAAVAFPRQKYYSIEKGAALDFILFAVPVSLVCARIYYIAFSWDQFADDLLSVFYLRLGGLAIYGAVIGGLLTAIVFARAKKIPFGVIADLFAPSLLIGQAIGRWGNFFNQEAYGTAVSAPAFTFFPVAVFIEATGQWHLATFFYESAWCFTALIIILIAERRGAFRKTGDLFAWYALLYAAERAVVEALRTDSLFMGGLRVSMILSLAIAAAVCVYFLVRAIMRRAWLLGPLWFVICMPLFGSGIIYSHVLARGELGAAWQAAASALALCFAIPLYRLGRPRRARFKREDQPA